MGLFKNLFRGLGLVALAAASIALVGCGAGDIPSSVSIDTDGDGVADCNVGIDVNDTDVVLTPDGSCFVDADGNGQADDSSDAVVTQVANLDIYSTVVGSEAAINFEVYLSTVDIALAVLPQDGDDVSSMSFESIGLALSDDDAFPWPDQGATNAVYAVKDDGGSAGYSWTSTVLNGEGQLYVILSTGEYRYLDLSAFKSAGEVAWTESEENADQFVYAYTDSGTSSGSATGTVATFTVNADDSHAIVVADGGELEARAYGPNGESLASTGMTPVKLCWDDYRVDVPNPDPVHGELACVAYSGTGTYTITASSMLPDGKGNWILLADGAADNDPNWQDYAFYVGFWPGYDGLVAVDAAGDRNLTMHWSYNASGSVTGIDYLTYGTRPF